MGKTFRRLVGLVLTVAAGVAFWLALHPSSAAVAELEPPGSTTVHLDQGTYDIVLDTHLDKAGKCRPNARFREVRRMRLELKSERGGIFSPRPRGSCLTSEHVGEGADRAVSVSTFEVPESGDYELRGVQLPAPAEPATVTLVQVGELSFLLMFLGAFGGIAGLTFLAGGKLGPGEPGEYYNHALHD